MPAADPGSHWRELVARIGHYRRLDAAITPEERARVVHALARRLAPFQAESGLRLPRAMVIVSGRR